jgi:hypothetical protein
MWEYFFGVGQLFLDNVVRLDRGTWVWVSAIVVALGFICMRGFGSRTNY